MLEEFQIRPIPLQYDASKEELRAFLRRHELALEDDVESAFGIFNSHDELSGCGCAAGSLLKCFAVSSELRGQNALGLLLSALVQDRFLAGLYDLFVITRAHNETPFANCGFFPVARTSALVMLENRPDGPEHYAAPFAQAGDEKKSVGAIVMNCNPFTLGHRTLVEYAAAHCDVLHLFVVEENRSCFPTQLRFQMVAEGTADLPNVRVHLSGPYIISSATFPTYFLKRGEDAAVLQSELDITLFASRIAPALHITRRFAGEEPLDPVTARYNASMRSILPQYGITFCEIPRIAQDGQIISASRVRTLLSTLDGRELALALLPPTTRRCLFPEKEG